MVKKALQRMKNEAPDELDRRARVHWFNYCACGTAAALGSFGAGAMLVQGQLPAAGVFGALVVVAALEAVQDSFHLRLAVHRWAVQTGKRHWRQRLGVLRRSCPARLRLLWGAVAVAGLAGGALGPVIAQQMTPVRALGLPTMGHTP